jgi:hypothetical protein
MVDGTMINKLTSEIRAIYTSGCADPDRSVEQYLDRELVAVAVQERLPILSALADRFNGDSQLTSQNDALTRDDIHHLVARFLGTTASTTGEMAPQELAEKFAGSLNALFDAVNQIVSVINVNLLGQSEELETIRKVIGANIQGETEYAAIKEYLERIRKAFLVSHQAFQHATAVVLDELLTELDPEILAKSPSSGLKFGPMRKADLFEQYEEKHARCKRWLQSGNYKEKLLREFERQCQLQFGGAKR